jgi:putative transposase
MQRLIEEAMAAGARSAPACRILGLSVRTVERWRAGAPDDQRRGPHAPLANALSAAERTTLLTTVNSRPYADLSPHQLVPRRSLCAYVDAQRRRLGSHL